MCLREAIILQNNGEDSETEARDTIPGGFFCECCIKQANSDHEAPDGRLSGDASLIDYRY